MPPISAVAGAGTASGSGSSRWYCLPGTGHGREPAGNRRERLFAVRTCSRAYAEGGYPWRGLSGPGPSSDGLERASLRLVRASKSGEALLLPPGSEYF